MAARGKRVATFAKKCADANVKFGAPLGNLSKQRKYFNVVTYKYHALGDYAKTIQRFGTTDSYSTQIVSCHS